MRHRMLLPLLREMLHTPVLDILHLLKRSTGMTVGELSTPMKMSYMGGKQHCDTLVEKGYRDTWRHPAMRRDDATDGLVPIHKLSQWLSYSLVEPLMARLQQAWAALRPVAWGLPAPVPRIWRV